MMFKLDIPWQLKEERDDFRKILFENGESLKISCGATGMHIYMVDHLNRRITLETKAKLETSVEKYQWKTDKPSIVAVYVANSLQVVLSSPVAGERNFPEGIPWRPNAWSVLCLPVLSLNNACLGVIELFREDMDCPFTEKEMVLANVILGWVGANLSFPSLEGPSLRGNQAMLKIYDMTTDSINSSFRGNDPEDEVICQFLKNIKDCVDADRISFFLYVYENGEESSPKTCILYDDGFQTKKFGCLTKKSAKIRYNEDIGIAWHATQEKKTIILDKTNSDPIFFDQYDLTYNYKTNTSLTFPIISGNQVLGAVTLINKINDPCFTSNDKLICKSMAESFALILHYYNTCERLEKTERNWKVTEDVLLNQLYPTEKDVIDSINSMETIIFPERFFSFSWYPQDEETLEAKAFFMLHNILDEKTVKDIPKLMKFVLTVRNSYRSICFHNFEHAVIVTHTAYIILKKNRNKFSQIEEAAIITAAICHDADHLGVTNSFLRMTNHALSQLYENSELENHHFHYTSLFIQNLEMFSHWNRKNFKKLMEEIKFNIIATDLTKFFETKDIIFRLLKKKKFFLYLPRHRSLMKALIMNSCDLSANCKPFSYAEKMARKLCEEFYWQGDKEKELGICPTALMNRNLASRLPEEQSNFFMGVIIPCFSLLASLIPNTEELYEGCLKVQKRWKKEIIQKNQNMWNWEESYETEDSLE